MRPFIHYLFLCCCLLAGMVATAQPNAYIRELPQGYKGRVKSIFITEQQVQQERGMWLPADSSEASRRMLEYDAQGRLLRLTAYPSGYLQDTVVERYVFRPGSDTCVRISQTYEQHGDIMAIRTDTVYGRWQADSVYTMVTHLWTGDGLTIATTTNTYDKEKRLHRSVLQTHQGDQAATSATVITYEPNSTTITYYRGAASDTSHEEILERDARGNPTRILKNDSWGHHIRTYSYQYY